MKKITMFSWGYWGWGTETKRLVKLVDGIEMARGYQPPIFVDMRISRAVRAPGFNGTAFEKLLGHERYVWMKKLGNRAITEGGEMRIHTPSAVNELLDFAQDVAKKKQRIIFFCSCNPETYATGCHRCKVGNLLLTAARRRGIRLKLIEWPGGKPKELEIPLNKTDFQKVRKLCATIPLPKKFTPVDLEGPPWASLVTFVYRDERILRLVGPAQWKQGRWYLPLFQRYLDPKTGKSAYQKESKEMIAYMGWAERRT